MKIVGYSNRLSVGSGQTIRFMVSSEEPSYRAEIVRLRHTDDNPEGPGFISEVHQTAISGQYPGRRQAIHTGSYAAVPHNALLTSGIAGRTQGQRTVRPDDLVSNFWVGVV